MHRDIIKFLKSSIILILFSFVFYVFLIVIFGELVPNNFRNNLKYNKADVGFVDVRFRDISNFQNIDLLFLGSSRSYRHYDTRFFRNKGIKSFNLGTGGLTFIQAEILLRRHIDFLNPKLIIFDVYPFMIDSDGLESSLLLINHSEPDKYFLNILRDHKNIKVVNSLIFSMYRNIFKDKNVLENYSRGDQNYVPGGFVESKLRTSKLIFNDTINFEIREFQLESLLSIKQLLEQKKIPVIFVHSPIHSKAAFKNENQFQALFRDNYLNYFDFKHLLFLNDSLHFSDPLHLNQDGVKLYNDYFYETILNKNYIP